MTGDRVNRHTLSNGLRIVHKEDRSTPNIAFDVIYDVGSRDEHPSLTGLAHLFEHLMFGGSTHVPHFDRELEFAGGWSNAWTSADFTNFYDVLPAVNAETAFWIESDRMESLLFSDSVLETQRSVVMEEFKQTSLNSPYGDVSHLLLSLIYERHPYAVPVIGKDMSHIERVTGKDVKQFFYNHYGPDNAIVSVTGNISFEHTVELAEKWFVDIAPIHRPARNLPVEPAIQSPRILTVRRKVPFPRIYLAFQMAGRDETSTLGYEAADTITDLLALGRSSRFYRNIIVPGKLTMADASISGTRQTGYLLVCAQLQENTDEAIARAIDILWQEIDSLKDDCISEDELRKDVSLLLTRMMTADVGFLNQAQSLALNTLLNTTDSEIISRYKRLTPDIIRRTACEILQPEKAVTLIYRPE